MISGGENGRYSFWCNGECRVQWCGNDNSSSGLRHRRILIDCQRLAYTHWQGGQWGAEGGWGGLIGFQSCQQRDRRWLVVYGNRRSQEQHWLEYIYRLLGAGWVYHIQFIQPEAIHMFLWVFRWGCCRFLVFLQVRILLWYILVSSWAVLTYTRVTPDYKWKISISLFRNLWRICSPIMC